MRSLSPVLPRGSHGSSLIRSGVCLDRSCLQRRCVVFVIDERLLLCRHQLWIICRATKTWATQANAVALAESPIRSCTVNLISADVLRVVAISAAMGHCLSLELFSFIIGIATQAIEEGESFAADRNRDLCTELNIATNFPADNRPNMGLAEAYDAIRNPSAVCVIENGLLADQLADHQQLLMDMRSGCKKGATTSDQADNAHQISLKVAKLLLDGFAYPVDTESLLLCHSKKLLPRLFAMRSRLKAKAFSDQRMHRINQNLSYLPRFIEQ